MPPCDVIFFAAIFGQSRRIETRFEKDALEEASARPLGSKAEQRTSLMFHSLQAHLNPESGNSWH